MGVHSEIFTPKEIKGLKNYNGIKGIILSGGPSTVTARKFQTIPKKFLKKRFQFFGICYGLQLIAKIHGGKIKSSNKKREFGRAILYKRRLSPLTKNFFSTENSVWMSHEDAVVKLPKNFKAVGYTKESKLTIIENNKQKIYGVQY